MGKALVIVESPAKIKTLKKFLGSNFIFESSIGHIRDLPQKEFGIDTEHDFEPKYVTLSDKKEVIKKLQDAAKKADIVYLSPDPDREGEAIAWHIASILPKGTKIKRTPFQSITKTAVQEALDNPRDIDMDLVDAQQARRLLDRIVGYKISPILTRKVKRGRHGTSAGRVQSVALKLVVDREKEIDAFTPVEYWNIGTQLQPKVKGEKAFPATLFTVNDLRVEKEKGNKECFLIPNEQTAKQITDRLEKATYTVESVDKKEKKRNPVPPFITSTLQQEASRHYGFSVSRTMNIAQGLYEGVDMGPDSEGLITYMRTDSVNIAPEAISNARKYILNRFGQEYLPDQPKIYASKKTAQEAHEAIRPTSLSRDPEKIRQYLSIDEYKLYLLIWRRFIASQMNPAIYDTVSADIATDQDILLRATGSVIKFNGYLAAYEEKKDKGAPDEDDDNSKILPPLEVNMPLNLIEVTSSQSFTKPPPRFTEASLVKELERLGIGRPSTYAAIMNKIQSRDYTTKESQALKPTELGKIICEMLEQNFPPIMDVTFTAQMENQLEEVAEHNKNWKEIIRDFWRDFIPLVEKAEKEAVVPKLLTDIDCPKCGKPLQKIWSRSKYFYGCSNYPECDYTAPIEALTFNKEDYDPNFDWDQPCPTCGSPMTLRHGRFGAFLGCSKYPDCKGIVNIPKKGEQTFSPGELPPCPAVGCDGHFTARKSRFGKTFFSCSNYPDCDVIVSTLDQAETKYGSTHPKTAYVKKGGKGKFAKKGAKGKKGSKEAPEKKKKKAIKQPAYKVSPELSKIVGATELSRPEATKKIWEYIKAHHLQDPTNKRRIIPDANLAKIIGKEPIDMMKLSSFLTKHLKK
ncbi:MAG: type I DNA topoisomerase [Chlamydiae bacterium CG10_big_fil_rev_8_21_14_0_10_42_34]|nr:MAG: type I DNA topoisomerase [Chlamydiae bacterium CG10_big_fil_rev_8_21_14_0_10_42_34]